MVDCLPEHEALLSELSAWQTENPNEIICSGKSVTDDGRLGLNLSINDTNFRFRCPSNYPNHKDPFFIETCECTDFCCVVLNDFVTNSPEKLTLDVILAKALLCYNQTSSNDDDESDIENASEDETESSDEATKRESTVRKMKREWREKESQTRRILNRPKISDMFDNGKIRDHPHQVFSNSAASEILMNDLIDIISNEEASGIVVDPVANDIYRWSVFLQDFRRDSRIFQDLIEAKELFGYDRVQLQLDFIMDLYPFYPPSVRIIRPKLIGVFEAKDSIKLANWNPAETMMSVLKEIRDYIENDAAIDFENTKNGINLIEVNRILKEMEDAVKLPKGKSASATAPILLMPGYDYDSKRAPASKDEDSSIEMILTKFLNSVESPGCENSPEKSVVDKYFIFNLSSNNNSFYEENYEVKPESSASTCSPSAFDATKQLLASERLRYSNQKKYYPGYEKNHCNITTNPFFGLGYESRNTRGLKLQKEKYSVRNVCVCETLSALFSHKNRRRHIRFLSMWWFYGISRKQFYNKEERLKFINSLKVVQRRREDYFGQQFNDSVVSSLRAKVQAVKESPTEVILNNPSLGLNENISCCSKVLEDSVLLSFIKSKLTADGFFGIWVKPSLYLKIVEVVVELASNPHLIGLLTVSDIRGQSIADLLKIQKESVTLILKQLTSIEKTDEYFMERVDLDKIKLARRIIDASKFIKSQIINYCSVSHCADPDSIQQDRSLDSVYKESLSDLKFRKCDIDPDTHAFKNEYISGSAPLPRNYFRFAQEFAALAKSLTIELSSSIFVRVDFSRPSIMRAMITGPEGTFCKGGCFSFDIYLRNNYPEDCGLGISCTTFSDERTSWLNNRIVSLSYRNDASCLDPQYRLEISNIFKVLRSIQTETLPSYEIWRENPEDSGSDESALSKIIRYSIIDKIREPTPGFEDVIAIHFRLKKDRIISELEEYDFLKNSELLKSLKTEFERLENTANL